MTVQQPITSAQGHRPYKFTQRDYLLLAEHGAFDHLAKTELIEGVIVALNAQFSRHVRAQTRLFRALAAACDQLGRMEAWIEGSVSIDDGSLPRPDIFIARNLPEDGPIPADRVLLAVEIADSSLDADLRKADLYAKASIPEYWVVDVNAGTIYQFWRPEQAGYAERGEIAFGAILRSPTIQGLELGTDDL